MIPLGTIVQLYRLFSHDFAVTILVFKAKERRLYRCTKESCVNWTFLSRKNVFSQGICIGAVHVSEMFLYSRAEIAVSACRSDLFFLWPGTAMCERVSTVLLWPIQNKIIRQVFDAVEIMNERGMTTNFAFFITVKLRKKRSSLLSDLAPVCYRYFRRLATFGGNYFRLVETCTLHWHFKKIKSQKIWKEYFFEEKVVYILYFKSYK